MKRGLYDCELRHLPNMHAIQAGQAQIRETKGGIATPAGSHTGDFLEKVHNDAMLHADGQMRSLKKMMVERSQCCHPLISLAKLHFSIEMTSCKTRRVLTS